MDMLKEMPEGDGIFRPSSKDQNHITLSWKVRVLACMNRQVYLRTRVYIA